MTSGTEGAGSHEPLCIAWPVGRVSVLHACYVCSGEGLDRSSSHGALAPGVRRRGRLGRCVSLSMCLFLKLKKL